MRSPWRQGHGRRGLRAPRVEGQVSTLTLERERVCVCQFVCGERLCVCANVGECSGGERVCVCASVCVPALI